MFVLLPIILLLPLSHLSWILRPEGDGIRVATSVGSSWPHRALRRNSPREKLAGHCGLRSTSPQSI